MDNLSYLVCFSRMKDEEYFLEQVYYERCRWLLLIVTRFYVLICNRWTFICLIFYLTLKTESTQSPAARQRVSWNYHFNKLLVCYAPQLATLYVPLIIIVSLISFITPCPYTRLFNILLYFYTKNKKWPIFTYGILSVSKNSYHGKAT